MDSRKLSTLLLCAFRYALGRRTYIVSEIAEMLVEYKNDIDEGYKSQIVSDITHAIEHNIAGDECDIITWERVREAMK